MKPDPFHEWRRRTSASFPALFSRILALQGKLYDGCGFHWALLKSFGYCLGDLNNFDKYFDVASQIVLEVCVESLFQQVKTAEASAKELAQS